MRTKAGAKAITIGACWSNRASFTCCVSGLQPDADACTPVAQDQHAASDGIWRLVAA